MEFIKQWCLCVCLSLIGASIMSLFTPEGSMKRFYKTLISLFVFVSFLYPFHDFSLRDLELRENAPVFAQENETSPYEDLLSQQVKAVLKEKGIIGVSVSGDISVNYQTGEIEVKKITVEAADEYDREEVKKTVSDALGVETEVIGIGE